MRGLKQLALACLAIVPLALASGAGAANGHANEHSVCPGPSDAARCHAHVLTDGKGSPMVSTAPQGYGPAQFQTAYGLAGKTSTQTIGIVDAYDDPYAESDLNTYSAAYGLPACTTANGCFRKVVQQGRKVRFDTGWALEISLDVQSAHAACPTCRILLVEATTNSFSNLLSAEDYAVANADVVSNSWGGSEFSGETSYDSHFNHPGTPITVSSGDNGYGVEYPASSPHVVAVGGTTLNLGPGNTYGSETVWSGSGSG